MRSIKKSVIHNHAYPTPLSNSPMASLIVVSEFDGNLAMMRTNSDERAKDHDDSVPGGSTSESDELEDEDEEHFLQKSSRYGLHLVNIVAHCLFSLFRSWKSASSSPRCSILRPNSACKSRASQCAPASTWRLKATATGKSPYMTNHKRTVSGSFIPSIRSSSFQNCSNSSGSSWSMPLLLSRFARVTQSLWRATTKMCSTSISSRKAPVE